MCDLKKKNMLAFFYLFQNLTATIFSVVGNVLVDNEICGEFFYFKDLPAQSLGDDPKDTDKHKVVCVYPQG